MVRDIDKSKEQLISELMEMRKQVVDLETLQSKRRSAQDQLLESQAKFESLAEQSPNMIFINKKGRILYANKKCEAVMGYRKEELYSPDFDFLTLIAPEFKESAKANFDRHIKGEEVPPLDYALITRGGHRIEAILATVLITYEGGTAILGTVTDISERKRAEEYLKDSEEKYRIIFEEARDGIVLIGQTGNIIDCNHEFERQTGRVLEELRKMRIWDIRPSGEVEIAREKFIEIWKEGVGGPVESEFLKPDGEIVSVEFRSRKIRIKGRKYIQSFVRDITQRKKLEQLKDVFISLVSHEFSSPLTVILGALRTIQGLDESLSPEERRRLLHSAITGGDHLDKMLGNLIELSKAKAGQLKPHTELINIQGVLQNLVNEIKQQSPTHCFLLNLEMAPLSVQADPIIFERILYNLLENAVKYSPMGSHVTVSIEQKNEELVFSVTDQGSGISFEDQERLFTPFQRLQDSRPNGVKGSGLGLALCRSLVEIHGGQIWVESAPGHGSTFFFTVPLSQPTT